MRGSEIVDLVIVKLEEKSTFLTKGNQIGPILTSGDYIDELKPVYSYIEAHLAEAADEMLMVAPLNMLTPVDGGHANDAWDISTASNNTGKSWALTSQASASDATGVVNLPVDFLRLYSFRMRMWERPVHKAITKSDHLYTLQHNKYTRGTIQKPVVVFSGNRVLFRGYENLGLNSDDLDKSFKITQSSIAGQYQSNLYSLLYSNGINDAGKRAFITMSDGSVRLYTVGVVTGGAITSASYKDINVPTLTYYSVTPNATDNHVIEELLYIPHFRETTEYNRDVAELIALNCAKKVAEVFGQTEQTTVFVSEIKNVIDSMK